jgi:DUF4097 and DUF4098 domain-containing protein YvlB
MKMFTVRKAFLIIPIVLLAVASLGCGAAFNIGRFTAEEVVSQSFEVSGTPHVIVETFNGDIDVVIGADNTVKADVTKRGAGSTQAAAQDDLKNIQVNMTQDKDTIHIIARRTNQALNIGNSGARAEVQVPAGAVLDLRSSNGHLDVNGATGDVTARTSNGRIQITGSTGRFDLDTSNGSIEVKSDSALVTAQTSNGQIIFTGALAQGDHSFRSSNGKITLTLPASASFRVNADTSNGRVTSDFAVKQSGGSDEKHLLGTVGENPNISIEAHTSNSNIEIRQGK